MSEDMEDWTKKDKPAPAYKPKGAEPPRMGKSGFQPNQLTGWMQETREREEQRAETKQRDIREIGKDELGPTFNRAAAPPDGPGPGGGNAGSGDVDSSQKSKCFGATEGQSNSDLQAELDRLKASLPPAPPPPSPPEDTQILDRGRGQ